MKLFWILFHKRYGYKYCNISCNIGFLGGIDEKCKWKYNYLLHDKKGIVKDGTKHMTDAIKKHKETGLYICKIHN